jgi:hypothetical protein
MSSVGAEPSRVQPKQAESSRNKPSTDETSRVQQKQAESSRAERNRTEILILEKVVDWYIREYNESPEDGSRIRYQYHMFLGTPENI